MDGRQCHVETPHQRHDWTMYYPSQTPESEGLARRVECYGVKDERVRFKATVRRRNADDDAGLEPEEVWPESLRWVADWDRHVCGTGEFVSGCASPFETFAEALAEAIKEADHVRRGNARMYEPKGFTDER